MSTKHGTNRYYPRGDSPRAAGLPNDVISVYDATGGQSFTGTITVNLDTTQVNTDVAIYILAADEITINRTGTFAFAYDFTCEETSGNDITTVRAFLEVDTGAGFAEKAGTSAQVEVTLDVTHTGTISCTTAFAVTAGDKVRLRASRVTATGVLNTIADASRLTVSVQT